MNSMTNSTFFSMTEKDGWTNCKDNRAGYSISVPSNWDYKVKITKDNGIDFCAGTQKGDKIKGLINPCMSLETEKTAEKVNYIADMTINIGGRDWVEVESHTSHLGTPMTYLELLTQEGDTRYTLKMWAASDEFSSYKETFNKIKSTVKLV